MAKNLGEVTFAEAIPISFVMANICDERGD